MKKSTKTVISVLVIAAIVVVAAALFSGLGNKPAEEVNSPVEQESFETQKIKQSDNYTVVSGGADASKVVPFIEKSCINKSVIKNNTLIKKGKKLSSKSLSELTKLTSSIQRSKTAVGIYINISDSPSYIAKTLKQIGCDELFLTGTESVKADTVQSQIKKIKGELKKEKVTVSVVLCLDEKAKNFTSVIKKGVDADKYFILSNADQTLLSKTEELFDKDDKVIFSFSLDEKTVDNIKYFDKLPFSCGRVLGSFADFESTVFEDCDLYLKGLSEYNGGFIKYEDEQKEITAYENEKKTVSVTAVSHASVNVKLGAQRFEASEVKYLGGGFSRYTAVVEFPHSKQEIDSILTMSVNVTFGAETKTKTVGTVVYRERATDPQDVFGIDSSSDITKQTVTGQETTLNVTESTQTSEEPNETTEPETEIVTQGQDVIDRSEPKELCMITSQQADTWLGSTNDDRFTPFTSNLIAGTMDYIVGESAAYDSDAGKTRQFYNLSCGRRVLKSSVQVLAKTELPDNTLSVLSSSCVGGELEIVIAQTRRVPFTFTYSPQEYYSQNGRLYNVSSFTANTVAFTFYQTSAHNGNVNVQGSNVVSGATFSENTQDRTVTLTMPLITQGRFYGYSARYDESGNLVLTVHAKPKSITGAVILLDPGHGGDDVGATNSTGTIYESNMNLAVAALVKTKLEQKGAVVYSTRYANESVTLDERKSMIYSLQPDIFVSIHSDAAENSSAAGTTAYYYKPMSSSLAKCIHQRLVYAYQTGIYSPSDANYSKIDRGSRFNPFSVTRVEDCPSVLIEMGFLTNDAECSALSYAENREKIAAAIADGIADYYSLQN